MGGVKGWLNWDEIQQRYRLDEISTYDPLISGKPSIPLYARPQGMEVTDEMVERASRHRAAVVYDSTEAHRELRADFIDRTWRQHSIIARSILTAALTPGKE